MEHKIAKTVAKVPELIAEFEKKNASSKEMYAVLLKLEKINKLISIYTTELNIREKELNLKQKELQKIERAQRIHANTLEYFEDSLDDTAAQLEQREILITAREKALERPE
ncbi:Hypothetical protein PACV_171 [Pacmanvirus A23]|uniref:Hypothetical protein n=1 Tax=Pacmanvirus A23 TaxID=1932881 RepID=UPI000A09353B|nr:Hypothetical protein B9W72_gp169 [Pacmanvirus A23]SIP85886.1 Hypothetical protein PACV_171 [Pacmanvirus A23]